MWLMTDMSKEAFSVCCQDNSAGVYTPPGWSLGFNGVRSLWIAAALVVTSGNALQAGLMIDSFNSGADVQANDYNSGTATAYQLTPNAIEGERDILLTRTGPSRVTMLFSSGVTISSPSSDTSYSGSFVWDGIDSSSLINYSGLSHVSLTAGGLSQILISPSKVDSTAHTLTLEFKIYKWDDKTVGAGSVYAWLTQSYTNATDQGYSFQYSNFTGVGDSVASILGHVGAIELRFGGTTDTDAWLGSVTAVPEVGTVWPLAAVAGLAIGCQWRSRRRQKASASTDL